MYRQILLTVLCVSALCWVLSPSNAPAQQAYGRQWAQAYNTQDWQRFYYYPYVYYPHNYYSPEYFQSAPNMFQRYPAEMQVPAYNRDWINFYPSSRRYHSGNHFRLDIF
ncbi:MAG: hypothetical protein LBU34_17135 [Planctomycetaceae bacterium]|jgi:hypothetical protein|nr:hypothetical protein [Planctomycetaceae bacterium]